ncbi:hypothetical protein LTR97_004222 [Elasticomyces elasticus]|uniref:Uncharacterized protein n=1 Tax=Elasticomyces elasticus TaxID=574655 RepID=A0AAN7WDJ2_9PEZI|nr:hypothetical protein LTR97_004222 [Elasticomyces elasticus]
METMHQQIAAPGVANDELRVRIYECFFEPDPQCSSPTKINLLDVDTIKHHAPDLAIFATSHLVRQEAYDIGKQAERKYFQDTRFTLEFVVPHNAPPRQVKIFEPDLRDTMAAVTSLPCLPISTLEMCLIFQLSAGRNFWMRFICTSTSDGQIDATREFGHGASAGLLSLGPPGPVVTFGRGEDDSAASKVQGLRLTRGKDPVFLNVGKLAEVVLYTAGWASAEHCQVLLSRKQRQ